ncbi:MAG: phosphoribosylamine--glycine ligase [Limisphaerales bacterium]|jgi:phosphoribosylamine--glycine ligase|nr:phosphoribosylamine--glycine ligase [Verrucomicrobiota bacterium]
MKILVVGSGGREHALVWKLAQSPRTTQLWCASGNAGIAQEKLSSNGKFVECEQISPEDLPALIEFAKARQPDLTVVSSDNPLGMGIVDLFQREGLAIWGPNKKAAQFESSKVFSQQFMERYGVPTAASGVFSSFQQAMAFAESLHGRCAVKVDGLALGKGVFVCSSLQEAEHAIKTILQEKTFGEAGARLVIQEYLEGVEVSLHALCDGNSWKLFPTSQDHKRIYANDQGPNTGGMGTYSPTPFLTDEELQEVAKSILEPWFLGCKAEGIDYRGILYPGIMLTEEGPKVLEFNARLGDPEAQVYLPRLKNDIVELLLASVNGTLNQVSLEFSDEPTVCVMLASAGYPGKYEAGKKIEGLDVVNALPGIKVFHSGTRLSGSDILTNGGRVLGVTAWADTLKEAHEKAYQAVDQIHFDGVYYRPDIAQKAFMTDK